MTAPGPSCSTPGGGTVTVAEVDDVTRIGRARKRALGALAVVAVGAGLAVFVEQALWLARGPTFAADHGLETMVAWAGSDSRRYFECLIETIERHPRDYRAEGDSSCG